MDSADRKVSAYVRNCKLHKFEFVCLNGIWPYAALVECSLHSYVFLQQLGVCVMPQWEETSWGSTFADLFYSLRFEHERGTATLFLLHLLPGNGLTGWIGALGRVGKRGGLSLACSIDCFHTRVARERSCLRATPMATTKRERNIIRGSAPETVWRRCLLCRDISSCSVEQGSLRKAWLARLAVQAGNLNPAWLHKVVTVRF